LAGSQFSWKQQSTPAWTGRAAGNVRLKPALIDISGQLADG